MNKISKDKRDKMILTCIVFLGIAGALYTFVLGAQKDRLAALQNSITSTKDKLSKAERLVRSSGMIEANLQQSRKTLDQLQENMAPQGQYFYWFLKLVDQFRTNEKLDSGFVVDISQPEFIEAGLLPGFPYKAASFGLRLNGRYHDVGRFIADLENEFPYFRVQNVNMIPQKTGYPGAQVKQAGLADAGEEKLIVELRVVTLIRVSTT